MDYSGSLPLLTLPFFFLRRKKEWHSQLQVVNSTRSVLLSQVFPLFEHPFALCRLKKVSFPFDRELLPSLPFFFFQEVLLGFLYLGVPIESRMKRRTNFCSSLFLRISFLGPLLPALLLFILEFLVFTAHSSSSAHFISTANSSSGLRVFLSSHSSQSAWFACLVQRTCSTSSPSRGESILPWLYINTIIRFLFFSTFLRRRSLHEGSLPASCSCCLEWYTSCFVPLTSFLGNSRSWEEMHSWSPSTGQRKVA